MESQEESERKPLFFKKLSPDDFLRGHHKVANEFFKTNPLESKYGRFYFAGGSIGLEMAVNQVVESSHAKIDLLILLTVLITCIISYRSFVGGFTDATSCLCKSFRYCSDGFHGSWNYHRYIAGRGDRC